VRLSAGMMVKDGGDLFVKTLASLGPVINELVLVNTDDRAQTRDMSSAEKQAVLSGWDLTVIHSPWQKNFSLHRNESIQPCTGDWILIIDSDEELKGGEMLREALTYQLTTVHSMSLTMHDMRAGTSVMQTEQRRVFRKGTIHYEGRVHNQPVVEGGVNEFCPEAEILHYGYGLDTQSMKKKTRRSIELLDMQIQQGDIQAYYYRAQQKGMMNEKEGAVADLATYLTDCRENPKIPLRRDAYFSIISSCLTLNRVQDAEFWLKQALKVAPDLPDVQFMASELGHIKQDAEMCVRGATLYLKARERVLNQPGSDFHFMLSDKHYAIALYRVAALRGSEVAICLEKLKEVLPKVPMNLAGQIQKELAPRVAGIRSAA
jgi:glycosyltransferase involved in cell wall biosynthesis